MDSTLSITTWNVLNQGYECEDYYTKEAHPFLHWNEGRGERAGAYLAKLDSDIYCLQEVSQAMASEIHASLGKEKYELLWKARSLPGDKVEDGCAIIYKKEELLMMSDFVVRYESGKHIFMACLFYHNDKLLWVVNTHVNWTSREADLLFLQREITTNRYFGESPKVVMGDFNAERHEAWYQALKENGIVDALYTLTHLPYSYNSGKMAKWIDFFLLHRIPAQAVQKVCVGNNWTMGDNFTDTALPNRDVPSDHLPVTVLLTIV